MQIYSGHHKEEFIKVMVIYKGLQYLYQGYHFNFAVTSMLKLRMMKNMTSQFPISFDLTQKCTLL